MSISATITMLIHLQSRDVLWITLVAETTKKFISSFRLWRVSQLTRLILGVCEEAMLLLSIPYSMACEIVLASESYK